jgi:hypothetical protein
LLEVGLCPDEETGKAIRVSQRADHRLFEKALGEFFAAGASPRYGMGEATFYKRCSKYGAAISAAIPHIAAPCRRALDLVTTASDLRGRERRSARQSAGNTARANIDTGSRNFGPPLLPASPAADLFDIDLASSEHPLRRARDCPAL